MKKTLWASYLSGLERETPGETYQSIWHYFFPELITALLLYSLVSLVDSCCIAKLGCAYSYATLNIGKALLHCIIKIAEGISVGTMVLCGIAHGRGDIKAVGRSIGSSWLITFILGGGIATLLGLFPHLIYQLLGAPHKIALIGIPYLRVRSLSIFCLFVFCTLAGLLRGVKKNIITMQCHIIGISIFIIADYVLVLGNFGFPRLGILGSAYAFLLYYSTMICYAGYSILTDPTLRAYFASVSFLSLPTLVTIVNLSWPVMCDKAILASAKWVISRAINPMGIVAINSFGAIYDIEMFIFVPAIAFAQVVTFLVSNQLGTGDLDGIKCTIKKVLFLAIACVSGILLLCIWGTPMLMGLLDRQHQFSMLAVPAFRIISLLVLCDVAQVILAGALRGMTQVRAVLKVRLFTLLFFCIPTAYLASHIMFYSNFVKFITIYSSFYIGNGIMVLWYVYLLRTGRWKTI
jgi:MATE family multidrug resistance protein